MWWASAIQSGLSLFSAGETKDAGRKARMIGGLNADAQREETKESIRRLYSSQRRAEGGARAVAAGSGFSQRKDDSQASYISTMIKEHAEQREWLYKSGSRQADILEKGGQLAYQQASAESVSQVGQGLSFGIEALWKAKHG